MIHRYPKSETAGRGRWSCRSATSSAHRVSGLLGRQFVLFLTIGIAGCALIGPDFKRPSVPIATKWSAADEADVNSGFAEYRDWWTVFHDSDLTRLVALAYRENLSLRATGVRVLEARAQLGMAIGEFYPQQQVASGSLSYNRIPGSLPYRLNQNTY